MKNVLRVLIAVLIAALGLPAAAKGTRVSLSVNVTQIFGTIDPAKVNDYTEYMAIVNLYDGLTSVDGNGGIVPQLAESWDISDDNKTYTFKLKQNATFQDGSPVEAKDVVWSLRRLIAINEGPAYLFSGLVEPENVRALGPHAVEITLNRVYAPFIATTPLILVVNSDLVKEKGDGAWGESWLGDHACGAGPYRLDHWTRGSGMTLSRYEGYHGGWPRKQPIDELRFVVTRDEATVKALAARGRLGMSSPYQASETYEAIGKLDDYNILTVDTATSFYLKLNNQRAPTDDVHIRRAIAYAMDYATVRDVIIPGGELKGPLAPAFADAVLDTLAPPEFNLEKAAQEIKKSKYAGSGPIKLTHSYVANTAFEEEIALLFKASLETIGFEVELQPEPWNRITELASSPETTPNVTQVFFTPTYPSPDSVFFVQYHSKAAGTWSSMSWVEDPEIDALIDASRKTVDTDRRNSLYKDIQARLHQRQSDVFLLTQKKRFAANICLHGYYQVPMQSFDYDFSHMWWDCDAKPAK